MFVAAARVCKVGKSRLQFAVTMMFTRGIFPVAFRLITANICIINNVMENHRAITPSEITPTRIIILKCVIFSYKI